VLRNKVLREGRKQETGETCIMRSFTKYYCVDRRRVTVGGTCSTHGKMRNVYKFSNTTLSEETTWETDE
jgi:hypothetical protein